METRNINQPGIRRVGNSYSQQFGLTPTAAPGINTQVPGVQRSGNSFSQAPSQPVTPTPYKPILQPIQAGQPTPEQNLSTEPPPDIWNSSLGYKDGGPVKAKPNLAAKKGAVKGPGTATSDSIPAKLSKGEFIIPAHIVKQYGKAFFTKLIGGSKEPDTDDKGRPKLAAGGITPVKKKPISLNYLDQPEDRQYWQDQGQPTQAPVNYPVKPAQAPDADFYKAMENPAQAPAKGIATARYLKSAEGVGQDLADTGKAPIVSRFNPLFGPKRDPSIPVTSPAYNKGYQEAEAQGGDEYRNWAKQGLTGKDEKKTTATTAQAQTDYYAGLGIAPPKAAPIAPGTVQTETSTGITSDNGGKTIAEMAASTPIAQVQSTSTLANGNKTMTGPGYSLTSKAPTSGRPSTPESLAQLDKTIARNADPAVQAGFAKQAQIANDRWDKSKAWDANQLQQQQAAQQQAQIDQANATLLAPALQHDLTGGWAQQRNKAAASEFLGQTNTRQNNLAQRSQTQQGLDRQAQQDAYTMDRQGRMDQGASEQQGIENKLAQNKYELDKNKPDKPVKINVPVVDPKTGLPTGETEEKLVQFKNGAWETQSVQTSAEEKQQKKMVVIHQNTQQILANPDKYSLSDIQNATEHANSAEYKRWLADNQKG